MSPLAPSSLFRPLLDDPAVQALRRAAQGVELHLVGGVLRDHALGLRSHDYDAVVPRDGLAIAQRLGTALPARFILLGGKDFAAYRLVAAGLTVDLWDRGGMSFEEDLKRRDFTINALALDVRTGVLVDRFGGIDDLAGKRLRAIHDGSFRDDPLRVLRLPRLALKLSGFVPDRLTLEWARRSSSALPSVAAERIRDELAHIFARDEAARGLSLLHALDLYPGLWLGRPGEPGGIGGALAEIEGLRAAASRLIQTLESAAGGDREPVPGSVPDLYIARLATTFLHLPEGAEAVTSVDHFRDAGYLSSREAQAVRQLLREERLPEGRLEQRRFLHRLGTAWGTAAASLAVRSSGGRVEDWSQLDDLARCAAREGGEAIVPPRFLTGIEIQALAGIRPGPRVGEILRALEAAQVDGEIRTRDEAEALALRLSSGAAPPESSAE